MIIIVISVSDEGNKYYRQVFLDECLHKLLTLKYDRIDVSKGIDVNKTSESCRCIICNYYYIFKVNFRFQPKVFGGSHDLM